MPEVRTDLLVEDGGFLSCHSSPKAGDQDDSFKKVEASENDSPSPSPSCLSSPKAGDQNDSLKEVDSPTEVVQAIDQNDSPKEVVQAIDQNDQEEVLEAEDAPPEEEVLEAEEILPSSPKDQVFITRMPIPLHDDKKKPIKSVLPGEGFRIVERTKDSSSIKIECILDDSTGWITDSTLVSTCEEFTAETRQTWIFVESNISEIEGLYQYQSESEGYPRFRNISHEMRLEFDKQSQHWHFFLVDSKNFRSVVKSSALHPMLIEPSVFATCTDVSFIAPLDDAVVAATSDECWQDDGLYVDCDFKPEPASFNTNCAKDYCETQLSNSIEWVRVTDLHAGKGNSLPLFSSTISSQQVVQGGLANAWFLGALGALADFDESAIRFLFVDDKLDASGKCLMRYYNINEEKWEEWPIDTLIPCKVIDDVPIPLGCRLPPAEASERPVWSLLVEKLFAKYSDHYNGWDRGLPSSALQLLTGRNNQMLYTRISRDGRLFKWYEQAMNVEEQTQHIENDCWYFPLDLTQRTFSDFFDEVKRLCDDGYIVIAGTQTAEIRLVRSAGKKDSKRYVKMHSLGQPKGNEESILWSAFETRYSSIFVSPPPKKDTLEDEFSSFGQVQAVKSSWCMSPRREKIPSETNPLVTKFNATHLSFGYPEHHPKYRKQNHDASKVFVLM